ncbi:hypothetical protein FB479_102705 [Brevibacillus sp. AG162]|nr:hypothetical protein FB479_102705 [Brevibacillus sp. AG162]
MKKVICCLLSLSLFGLISSIDSTPVSAKSSKSSSHSGHVSVKSYAKRMELK